MVEFHVQSAYNREKIIMGFVNNGYSVRVIEKPDPKRYLGILYYVQVEGDDLKNELHTEEEIKDFTKAELMAINEMSINFIEKCKKWNGSCVYNTSEGIVDVLNLLKKLKF